MSNDRIWIVCDACGEGVLVTQWWPGPGHLTASDRVNPFLDKHLNSCRKVDELDGRPGFRFVTDDEQPSSIREANPELDIWVEVVEAAK